MNNRSQGALGGPNHAIKRHFKLQIKTLLQNAPRNADRFERLLRLKEREKEEAMHIEDTHKKVSYIREIEMLKVVLCLVARSKRRQKIGPPLLSDELNS
jgi:hypothetical protein